MGSHNRRPLQEELMTAIGLFLSDLVIQIAVLEAQTVELANVPREKRRVTFRLQRWAVDAWRIVKKKAGRPTSVEPKLSIAVAAPGFSTPAGNSTVLEL